MHAHIRELYRFTKLKQKLGANHVPFLLPRQAWYKILSLSRAKQERRLESARERRYQQGEKEGGKERERERVKKEEGEKDKEAENCASRENGKPENDHRPKARYAVSLPLLRSFFSPSIFYPSLFPHCPSLAQHHPRLCARPARGAVSEVVFRSPPPPPSLSAGSNPRSRVWNLDGFTAVMRTVNTLPAEKPAILRSRNTFPPALLTRAPAMALVIRNYADYTDMS